MDAIVEARITALATDAGSDDTYAGRRKLVLEELFSEQSGEDTTFALDEMRARFTNQVTTDGEDASGTQFDELAYTNELHQQVVELQPLMEAELVALAQARAENMQSAILGFDENLLDRTAVGKTTEVTKKADEMIRMKVTLSSASEN